MRDYQNTSSKEKEASKAMKYRFVANERRVTVYAKDLASAKIKALTKLNRRCDRAGIEPPVGWDISLISEN